MTEIQVLVEQLGTFSYLGIFGISFLANVVIPVPEEIVLLALGYVAHSGAMSGFVLVPIVMAGLLASDIVMYLLSKKHNRLVTLFYQKVFAPRLRSKRGWLEAHPEKVIFFSRFLVQLRFLGPFMAGQMNVSWRTFIVYELAALVLYVPILIAAGYYFRDRIELIASGVGIVRNGIIILVALAVVLSISKFVYRYLFGEKGTATENSDSYEPR